MSKEDLKNTSSQMLESLKGSIDYELLRRDNVSPEVFLQVHKPFWKCLVSEKSVGFSNADIEGGGIIIGATEIMQLICSMHGVVSAYYAKGNVTREERQVLSWRW